MPSFDCSMAMQQACSRQAAGMYRSTEGIGGASAACQPGGAICTNCNPPPPGPFIPHRCNGGSQLGARNTFLRLV
eukprot:363802-Chlamydomonas_euryale.AAC.4